jgi:hypothetical protein
MTAISTRATVEATAAVVRHRERRSIGTSAAAFVASSFFDDECTMNICEDFLDNVRREPEAFIDSVFADRYFDLDAAVIVEPAMDACVYVANRLLYHLQHPNRRFFLDLAGHQVVSRADVCEGGDDTVTESVDIELGSILARLHAQVLASEPNCDALVAKYLRRCADCFETPPSNRRLMPVMPDV